MTTGPQTLRGEEGSSLTTARCPMHFCVVRGHSSWPSSMQTVREDARLEELAHCVEERGVEILGVQEHRRVHTDLTIKYQRVGGCTFITSSAWRNDAQAATGGVGFMVSPQARKALHSVHQHSDRILIAEFEGNPVTTVMSAYSHQYNIRQGCGEVLR